jgi:dolichyl-phosphate-mannose--protein O-mannosyl transferase
MTKKDYLIMLVMTAVYAVIAFINLGSPSAPEGGYVTDRPGRSVIVHFKEETEISRITYYIGLGDDWNCMGALNLEYMDEKGNFKELVRLENPANSVFKWKHKDVEAVTRAVRVETDLYFDEENERSGTKGEFVEVAFFTEYGRLIPIASVEPEDEGSVGLEALFDEQDEAVYEPSHMNSTYFDEVYFPRTAYEYIKGGNIYENTHPPLGKVIIMFSIRLFGMNAFAWRFMGTLFGVLMIPVMYVFGKKMFKDTFAASLCAFLMMFDFMHFVQTRIGTVDGFLVLFILMAFFWMYDYFMNKSYDLRFIPSLKPLFLCGIFFGLGVAVKWIGLFAGAGLAFLFFTSRILEYIEYRRGKVGVKGFRLKYIWGTMGMCVIFFIVVPAAIYFASYAPVFKANGTGDLIAEVIRSQKHMFNYHSGVDSSHPYASMWWQWPFMVRPVYYYLAPALEPGRWASIASFGNPAVWWAGFAALFAAAWTGFKKKDKRVVFIIVGYLSILLPWAFSPRKITFLYHYFACVPFLIFAIVYFIKNLMDKKPEARKWVYLYMALVAVLFICFYPSLSGMEVPEWYTRSLRWLPSWFF